MVSRPNVSFPPLLPVYSVVLRRVVELLNNSDYTDRIDKLRELAAADKKGCNELAFRFLQVLEHPR